MSPLSERVGRWKDASAAVQSIAVSLAFICGGFWAIWTNQVGQIKEQIATLKRGNREQGVLDLLIETRPVGISVGRSHRLVCIIVSATNKGNRNMLIRFDSRPPIIIARVHIPEADRPLLFDTPQSGWFFAGSEPGRRLTRHVLRIAEVYHYSTVVEVTSPGLYWVAFNAEVNADDSQAVAADLQVAPGQMQWCTGAFFSIE